MSKNKQMPLVQELRDINNTFLDEQYGWEVPKEILKNLVHELRYYQIDAIEFYHLTQFSSTFKYRDMNHVLFHMATGSGKTDLMAALILYMYKEMDYQNFIFTVNTKSVINKTIENLIDSTSSKYLYTDTIEMDNERITIKKVDVFPKYQTKNTIYIKMDTIQSIASDLYTVKENTMGEKAYAQNKVAIFGDEAHHYSASTKEEKETENSWENAIDIILNARDDNKLLEFTATIDLGNKKIYNKYKDKVIYQYDLSRYMEDRYSKNIRRIQSNNSDIENMLNVILLSEYRRRYAREELGSRLKPVILFKSQRIDDSIEAEKQFNGLIENLTVTQIITFIQRQRKIAVEGEAETLEQAYQYYEDNQDNLNQILLEIKREFSPSRVINANDSSQAGILEKGQYEALNSLESPDNIYRVIFAVAKLTEGWDVLNLYDIVRISDAPKTSGTKTTTNSEAQLIGRGARYNPFIMNNKKSYRRRFEDLSIPSLLTETLHYHTINEPQYLKNLVDSLDEMDLPTGVDIKHPLIDVKVKPSFKRTNIYKKGCIYYNKVVDILESYYEDISRYGIDNKKDISINWINVRQEFDYITDYREDSGVKLRDIEIKYDKRYWKKAFSRNSFYHFNNLKKYLPKLNSIEEFVGEKWLNIKDGRKLFVKVAEGMEKDDLSARDKLGVIETYLSEVENQIKTNYRKQRGTNKFIGYPIKDYISDYRKRVPKYDLTKYDQPQFVDNYAIDKESFIYKNSIMNRTEKELVDRVLKLIDNFGDKYDDAYLIRMDENMHRESPKGEDLKLHQFDEGAEVAQYSGFQPDFILLLTNSEYYIQIFIEAKAEGRYLTEKWKEDLLQYINEHEAEIVISNEINTTKIKGLKFYFYNDSQGTIKQLKEMLL